MIESVRIVGVMEDGSKKEIRTLPTDKEAVGGVRGFFDDVKEQYVQIIFEDKTFVCVTEEKLRRIEDE